jgi:hypothetical protein
MDFKSYLEQNNDTNSNETEKKNSNNKIKQNKDFSFSNDDENNNPNKIRLTIDKIININNANDNIFISKNHNYCSNTVNSLYKNEKRIDSINQLTINRLIDENNLWINIKDYDPQTLKIIDGDDDLDIMEIWRPESFLKIKNFDYGGDIRDTGTLIWIRQDQGEDKLFTYFFNEDSIDMFVKIFGNNWKDEIGKKAFGNKYRNALTGIEVNGGETITFYVRN